MDHAYPDDHAEDAGQLVPQEVSHFQIEEKLGGGGMGVVYRAQDLRLGRTVALKFLPPSLSRQPEAMARFVQEAKAASALDHPNICSIYEIDETRDGRLFIAMAYYPGETLKTKIGRGPLPVKEAVHYAVQIARGLARAHEGGIVHRDIKPANVMVTDRGEVKILDFGLAKMVDVSITKTGTTLGTVGYMSPEQARGVETDGRTDLWSVGVLLYEMLAGSRPFRGEYEQAVIYSILHHDPEPLHALPPAIPSKLSSIVARLLQKKPEGRYQGAEELLRDLLAIGAQGDVAPSTVFRAPRVSWRRPVLIGGGALLVILLFAFSRMLISDAGAKISSIAVLPLANLSQDAANDYFADGMHEALIGELAQIGAIRVISRTSTLRYRTTDLSIPEIARELDVDAVVEASLIEVGETVRIRAQLIDALPAERHLWTEVYERKMQDVPSLHSDVARQIAQEIDVELTPQERNRLVSSQSVNPQAYEDYLRGRFYLYNLNPDDYETALGYFQSALDADPNYAPALVGVASVWSHLGQWGGVAPREAYPEARKFLIRALEIDNSLAEAHMVSAGTSYCYDWDWEAAESSFHRAIDINPSNAEVRLFYGDFLLSMRRLDEALAQIQLGLELDPLNPFAHTMMGWGLLAAGRFEESEEHLRIALDAEPDISLAIRCLWTLYYLQGMHEAAFEQAKRFYRAQASDHVASDLDEGFAGDGYEAAYRLAADRLADRARQTYVPAMRIARLYTFAGDEEAALDHLEDAYEQRFASMFSINVDPHWNRLHDNSRFQALLGKMQLEL